MSNKYKALNSTPARKHTKDYGVVLELMHFILLWYYILLCLIYWLLAEIVILTFDLLEEYLEILNNFCL